MSHVLQIAKTRGSISIRQCKINVDLPVSIILAAPYCDISKFVATTFRKLFILEQTNDMMNLVSIEITFI